MEITTYTQQYSPFQIIKLNYQLQPFIVTLIYTYPRSEPIRIHWILHLHVYRVPAAAAVSIWARSNGQQDIRMCLPYISTDSYLWNISLPTHQSSSCCHNCGYNLFFRINLAMNLCIFVFLYLCICIINLLPQQWTSHTFCLNQSGTKITSQWGKLIVW